MLQDYRPNRSNLTTAERYQCDIGAVDAGIPVREAAKRFEVTRESLRLRFLGLRPLDCRCGPQLLYINEDVYSRPSNFALRGVCALEPLSSESWSAKQHWQRL
ncbi:hypothetical protein PI124_g20282 [Phytophthora idaei]|nr:hypothetical protein PI125_g23347 [Phytophthora idaei]KAG3128207.1 hypothetical protein PI126_g21499 [Phytophthora idaei]KAG3234665.1 hypothetical protein PI124_g20282 [Phytophthora idaei]